MLILTSGGEVVNFAHYERLIIVRPDYLEGRLQVWAVKSSYRLPSGKRRGVEGGTHIKNFGTEAEAKAFTKAFYEQVMN